MFNEKIKYLKRKRFTPPKAELFTLLIILICSHSTWVTKNLYFKWHTFSEIILSLGSLAFLVAVAAIIATIIFKKPFCAQTLNIASVLSIAYIFYGIPIKRGLIPQPTPYVYKIISGLVILIIAGIVLKIGTLRLKSLHRPIWIAALCFISVPPIFGSIMSQNIYWPSPSAQPPQAQAQTKIKINTIFILLDELNNQAGSELVNLIKQENLKLTIKQKSINSIGQHTIDVIPSIFLRQEGQRWKACGSGQICTSTEALDFGKIQTTNAQIDIVGFYHPYCDIVGLRYCHLEKFPANAAISEVFCNTPIIDRFLIKKCAPSTTDRNRFIELRRNLEEFTFSAPFWEKGGMLYAHMLEPHPLMGKPEKSLDVEYQENLIHAAQFVKKVIEKAQKSFGEEFLIIIFSDHPLRREMWCKDPIYAEKKCPKTISENQVPLIAISSATQFQTTLSPTKNSEIFDILYK